MLEEQKANPFSSKIRIWPDKILLRRSTPVENFDSELGQTIVDMFLTMRELGGIGLAGVQVGLLKKIIVYKVDGIEGVMINPEITDTYGKLEEDMEGCLSFPGLKVKVKRYPSIRVKFQDPDGVVRTLEPDGLVAKVIQHELEHIEGTTILQYLSKTKRDIINRKLEKISRQLNRATKATIKRLRP